MYTCTYSVHVQSCHCMLVLYGMLLIIRFRYMHMYMYTVQYNIAWYMYMYNNIYDRVICLIKDKLLLYMYMNIININESLLLLISC